MYKEIHQSAKDNIEERRQLICDIIDTKNELNNYFKTLDTIIGESGSEGFESGPLSERLRGFGDLTMGSEEFTFQHNESSFMHNGADDSLNNLIKCEDAFSDNFTIRKKRSMKSPLKEKLNLKVLNQRQDEFIEDFDRSKRLRLNYENRYNELCVDTKRTEIYDSYGYNLNDSITDEFSKGNYSKDTTASFGEEYTEKSYEDFNNSLNNKNSIEVYEERGDSVELKDLVEYNKFSKKGNIKNLIGLRTPNNKKKRKRKRSKRKTKSKEKRTRSKEKLTSRSKDRERGFTREKYIQRLEDSFKKEEDSVEYLDIHKINLQPVMSPIGGKVDPFYQSGSNDLKYSPESPLIIKKSPLKETLSGVKISKAEVVQKKYEDLEKQFEEQWKAEKRKKRKMILEEEEKLRQQRVKILRMQLENEKLKEKQNVRKQMDSEVTRGNDSYVSRISLNNNSLIQTVDENDRLYDNFNPYVRTVEENTQRVSYDHNADLGCIFTQTMTSKESIPPLSPNPFLKINKSRTPLKRKSKSKNRRTKKSNNRRSRTPIKESQKYLRLSLGIKPRLGEKEIRNLTKKNYEKLPENLEKKRQMEREEEVKRRLRRKKVYSQVRF